MKDKTTYQMNNFNDPEEKAVRRRKRLEAARKKASMQDAMNTMACLNRMVKRLRVEDYSEELMEDMHADVEYVCGKFGITPVQTMLLAVIAEVSGCSDTANTEEISRYFGVTNLELMSLMQEIDDLSRKHIVRITVHRRSKVFEVYQEAMQAIISDSAYSAPGNAGIGTEEIFSRMRKLFSEFFDDALSALRLSEELSDLVDSNPESLFCRKVRETGLPDSQYMRIFLYLCHRYGSHGEDGADIDRILMLLDPDEDGKRVERQISRECTPLHKAGLVDFCAQDGFVDMSRLGLSETVRKDFFTELKIDPDAARVPQSPDLKDHTLIAEKRMFYNAAEREQMGRLERLLSDDNFTGVQRRLEEQGMRKGVNIIMYGPAGTGKTESCLQLARRTGRDILLVDVSKLKSKWVGDSEKSVRGLFKYYRELVKHSERTPILLFNEADAIFGVRMKVAEQSVDKMNNAIQNIILQEMETLDGILIATTNLETNLDPAFERRFLFKVRFSLPEEEAREKIWRSMLPGLSARNARDLARRYSFSGGQIENVTRKSMIGYIIDGRRAGIAELTKYCDEERLGRSGEDVRRIGFE